MELIDNTLKFDYVISPLKVSKLLWNLTFFITLLQQSLIPIFASFHIVDRDLQKYRHLQMSFTYDVIDVFLRRTIYGMVSKIL